MFHQTHMHQHQLRSDVTLKSSLLSTAALHCPAPEASWWDRCLKTAELQVTCSWTWKSTQLYPPLGPFEGHNKYSKVKGKIALAREKGLNLFMIMHFLLCFFVEL